MVELLQVYHLTNVLCMMYLLFLFIFSHFYALLCSPDLFVRVVAVVKVDIVTLLVHACAVT